jgi:hypothetical protein
MQKTRVVLARVEALVRQAVRPKVLPADVATVEDTVLEVSEDVTAKEAEDRRDQVSLVVAVGVMLLLTVTVVFCKVGGHRQDVQLHQGPGVLLGPSCRP